MDNYSSVLKSFIGQDISAFHLATEGRDYLMWCPDAEFDRAIADLDMRGLVELIHTLQDAMAVEQQTFESLSQQLEQVEDPLLQQRMSAALCTSQTRLARLCSRNMRCFTQQALKSRQRDQSTSTTQIIDTSRSSSPRDSGLAISPTSSDLEGDRGMLHSLPASSPPSSGSHGHHSFRNSLTFFQKAANIVSHTARSSIGNQKNKDIKKQAKQYTEKPYRDDIRVEGADVKSGSRLGRRSIDPDDNETYEQVLYINGRPQFQNENDRRNGRSSSLERTSIAVNTEPSMWKRDRNRSRSWTRTKNDRDSAKQSYCQPVSVDPEPSQRSVEFSNPAHSRSLGDVATCVTLPRRKPVLNFGSVSDDGGCEEEQTDACSVNHSSNVSFNRDFESRARESDHSHKTGYFNTITRAHSFKEGLDLTYDIPSSIPLTRAHSLYDGLDTEFGEQASKAKLSKAPSVEEILESVKTLRVKKGSMVKSSPDLLLQISQDKMHPSSRHKNGKANGKTSKPSTVSTSSSSGIYSNSSVYSSDAIREKIRKPPTNDSKYYGVDIPYYENIGQEGVQYENLPAKKVEVIYDSPKHSKIVSDSRGPDKRDDQYQPPVDHYENVDFDPVYENIDENEPTYMNISSNISSSNNINHNNSTIKDINSQNAVYANMDDSSISRSMSRRSKHNRGGLLAISFDDDQTYDVPKAATHIYDTPPKHTRKVKASSSPDEVESNYDTPQNNRAVLSNSSQLVLSSKTEQIRKIEDIFADCERDSLEGDPEEEEYNSPRIPPPDYGIEVEHTNKLSAKSDAASDYIDEGLGESDSRSYYADDQGLEVILEEPEDDYSSSHSSEEDLRRRLDLQLRHKGERRSLGSLEGSEGIGSAEGEEEGDSHSSGSSEQGTEEDCSSSGIHSEDTPSPGPPSDNSKDCCSRPPENSCLQESEQALKKDEDQTQKDRCVEVYPETLRQRQRNMAPSPSKVDIKNWEPSAVTNEEGKKFLPSVKALRNQFENGKAAKPTSNTLTRSSSSNSSSTNSLVMLSLENSSGFGSLNSSQVTIEQTAAPVTTPKTEEEESVEPIFSQFKEVDEELKQMMSKPPSTQGWNPQSLLKRLYYIPDAPKIHRREAPCVNIEGYLEKLPSGRKKATFWNAWKRRYFVAKDGILYYYQNNQSEKPNMKLPLMGGKIEIMDPTMVTVDDGGREARSAGMLGIDDGKGHYVVVRCPSRQEAERWKKALETHTLDDFSGQYVQPWPRPTNPTLLRDTLVIDIGSCSVRAGVLASQPTLPQIFFPSVVATHRESKKQIWGIEALMPEVRSNSSLAFPVRPSHKISKFSVDLNAVSSLLQKTFNDLKVDPKNYNIQLSVPRVLNPHTQTELLKILFDKFGVKSVNLTHQSILALYAYNATSGIIVDIGERLDVVPVIDGYIVDGGVSRVPYGGYRIIDHIRQFLFQKNISLANEVESYCLRQVLETVCYCAKHYNTEKQRCTMNPEAFEKSVPLAEYFPENSQYDIFKNISLDFARFQATEGLFNPDAWGLDHPGLHKLVHKAIQECSMDIRKEMSRSIFLAGGVSQLPGVADRLSLELDNLTPPAVRPVVHASPYRYHAAYLGACVLAESDGFAQSKITKDEWIKQGSSALRKWAL